MQGGLLTRDGRRKAPGENVMDLKDFLVKLTHEGPAAHTGNRCEELLASEL